MTNEKTPTGELTDEQIDTLTRQHGTGGWMTLSDCRSYARAVIAADRALRPAQLVRPVFGAIGSRDVDVAAGQRAFDAALVKQADTQAALAAKDARISLLSGRKNELATQVSFLLSDGRAMEVEIAKLTAERDELARARRTAIALIGDGDAEIARLTAERDGLKHEIANARALLVDVYGMLPEQAVAARQAINKRTGNWFAWGIDRMDMAKESGK